LPWWSASSSLGLSVSLSLASLESLSRGIELRPGVTLSLQPELVAGVQAAFALILLGGILGVTGGVSSKRVLEAVGGLLTIIGIVAFLYGLISLGKGTWILGGSFGLLGLSVQWGVSYGILVAGISAILMLASSSRKPLPHR